MAIGTGLSLLLVAAACAPGEARADPEPVVADTTTAPPTLPPPPQPIPGAPTVTVPRPDGSGSSFSAAARVVGHHEITAADGAAVADCQLEGQRDPGTDLVLVDLGLVNSGEEPSFAPRVEVSFTVPSTLGGEHWWVTKDDGDLAGVMSVGDPEDHRVACVADLIDVDVVGGYVEPGAWWLGRTGMQAGERHRATVLVIVPPDSGATSLGVQVSNAPGTGQQIELIPIEGAPVSP